MLQIINGLAKCSRLSRLEVSVYCRAQKKRRKIWICSVCIGHSSAQILSEVYNTSSSSSQHNFLWTLYVFQGERATSDISSWAHLINKWINYARFMGWCTSKHFKGHAECPWGAVMRGSSPQRQIWWPRFMWTWSFSHFVRACSFLSPALCHSVSPAFLLRSFPHFFPLSVSRLLLPFPSLPLDFHSVIPLHHHRHLYFQLSWDLRFFLFHALHFYSSSWLSAAIIYPFNINVVCSVSIN